MTIELKVMVGIPGAGKSFYANQEMRWADREHYTTCIISRDRVRQSMLTEQDNYFDKEKEVFDEYVRQINEAMECGVDFVFADATHISSASRVKLLKRLRPDPRTKLTFEVINCPIAKAIEQNSQRTGFSRVPESVIKTMANKFTIPSEEEFPENKWGFSSIKVNIH